jgi:hypothetical protein
MPLYHTKDIKIIFNPILDSEETILRRMWTLVVMHSNEYLMENGKRPKIFVSDVSFEILNKSSNFSYVSIQNVTENFLGFFQNYNVYSSNKLIDDEYYIGLNEKEIEIYRRKNKLEKICGVIMEEKQR